MMGIVRRMVFREVAVSALLGTLLFTFVLFLQQLRGELFQILVRSSAPPETVVKLFLMLLPPTLPFTLPLGVLVGVLIGLSRMSSDGEITGMRAAGISGRRVVAPILMFSFLAMGVTACASLWLTPLSIRQTYATLNKLLAEQLTAEIQPRVFEEQFPNWVIYVGDVIPGPVVRWRQVFMADLRPAAERGSGPKEKGDAPSISLSREAIAVPDNATNSIQLTMFGGTKHEVGKTPSEYYNNEFDHGAQKLYATRPGEKKPSRMFSEMDTGPLWREARKSREAAIELHRRFALPMACVLLSLVGIPLGVSSRKAGKSGAFVITVALAFLYYIGMVSLVNLTKEGRISVVAGSWTPNAVFALAGIVLLIFLESPGDRDFVGFARTRIETLVRRMRRRSSAGFAGGGGFRFPLLPQLVDTYVLSNFVFYFAVLLASFVLMTHIFTFFELLSDILKRNIPMSRVLAYHFFLTPKLIYDSTPISVLVGALVTFGIMAKHNEVTAFKASGVSLYRLAMPVLAASLFLSGGLFAFDHYYVPEANRRQDEIRDEIKGRAKQTYLDPSRKWIMGQGPRIYYYKYFNPDEQVMAGVSVYEIDMQKFRLRRHIFAERARWQQSLNTWVFENGWSRNIDGIRQSGFSQFQAATFPELDEPPSYFMKEVKQYKQMNFIELEDYIQELRQSGFDTVQLQVQLQKKFSVPFFALVMALISVPFAFMTGNRGAMAGVGVSFGIAIAYWAISQLFEQIGNLNQLPAAIAAWSPDAIFSLAGVYLMARLKS